MKGKSENDPKLRDIELLANLMEHHAEHSRWSTAITLLISISIASLIAVLGLYSESPGFQIFDSQSGKSQNDADTLILQYPHSLSDSIFYSFNASREEKSTNNNCKINFSLQYIKTINRNTVSKLDIIIQQDSIIQLDSVYFCRAPLTIEPNTAKSYSASDSLISSFIVTKHGDVMSKNYKINLTLHYKKSVDKNTSNKLDVIIQQDAIIQLNTTYFYKIPFIIEPDTAIFLKKNVKKESQNSGTTVLLILFSAITFVGLIFTIFFYYLREIVDKKIEEEKKRLDNNKR